MAWGGCFVVRCSSEGYHTLVKLHSGCWRLFVHAHNQHLLPNCRQMCCNYKDATCLIPHTTTTIPSSVPDNGERGMKVRAMPKAGIRKRRHVTTNVPLSREQAWLGARSEYDHRPFGRSSPQRVVPVGRYLRNSLNVYRRRN
jgi:hypothetical protein